MEKQFPSAGVELTRLLVVSNIEQSRSFYRDVLGAEVYREYGGTSCVLNFQGSWNYEIRCFSRDPDGHLLEISQLV